MSCCRTGCKLKTYRIQFCPPGQNSIPRISSGKTGNYRRTRYGYGSVLPKTTPEAGTEKPPWLWATSVAANKDPMAAFFFIFSSTKAGTLCLHGF